ncbi:tetratricopeptide repeat protein [Cyclobacterium xiamenense]|uniref:tetratricopeptide repeat protein n=1 Tax=Cyclobacterium xiamenense TaxID=1297121 RepID=UPI0035D0954E
MDKEKAIEKNNQGATCFLNSQYDKALAYYQEAIDLDPSNPSILNNLGLYFHQQQEYAIAVDYFKKAHALVQKPHFLVNQGNALAMLEKFQEADRCYEQALVLDPTHKGARIGQAQLAMHAGDYQRAIRCWKKLQQEDAESGYAVELAKVYMKLESWEKALNQLHGIQIEDGDALAWRMIGQCEYQLKNFGLAVKAFKMALAENPEQVGIRQHLAVTYLAMGRSEEGIYQLEVILRLEPTNYQIMTELAVVFLSKGERAKAIAWLEKALSIQPDFLKAIRYKKLAETAQQS